MHSKWHRWWLVLIRTLSHYWYAMRQMCQFRMMTDDDMRNAFCELEFYRTLSLFQIICGTSTHWWRITRKTTHLEHNFVWIFWYIWWELTPLHIKTKSHNRRLILIRVCWNYFDHLETSLYLRQLTEYDIDNDGFKRVFYWTISMIKT